MQSIILIYIIVSINICIFYIGFNKFIQNFYLQLGLSLFLYNEFKLTWALV